MVALLAVLAPGAQAAASQPFTVIAEGLDNPRGLAFGPDGALYVAEAGRGGTGPCIPGPEGGQVCFGLTGAVTRIKDGRQSRPLTGLPSLASPEGIATGPSDVSFRGLGFLTIGLGADPAARAQLPPSGRTLGQLTTFVPGLRRATPLADVAGYEASANPDGGQVDSNPQGVHVDQRGAAVTDAGGNSLVRVGFDRRVQTLATFDSRMVAAPPLPGQPPQVYATGLTNAIDLAFGPSGTLYVLEIAHNSLLADKPVGALVKVSPGRAPEVVLGGLNFPTGLTIRGNTAYLTDCGVCVGGGRVLQVPL